MNAITLYGTPLSLYTGRARSYFIKAGLAYREVTPNNPHYLNVVVLKAGGRQGMPTFETPEGNVIRDGAAIIEHFEAIAGHPFSPSTPKQRILSLLFDVIGAEGLLRPAMHYRWNFSKENLDFLRFHFQSVMPAGPDRAAKADAAAALCINQWIDAQEGLAPGTPLLRGVGLGSFEVRGITINALAQPYRFFLLKRMQSAYASLPKPDQQKVANMLRSCDMQELLEIALSRDIGRENNLEIWL